MGFKEYTHSTDVSVSISKFGVPLPFLKKADEKPSPSASSPFFENTFSMDTPPLKCRWLLDWLGGERSAEPYRKGAYHRTCAGHRI